MSRIIQLNVNGEIVGKATAKPKATHDEIVAYVKTLKPDFDEKRDTLEVIDITPEDAKTIRHKARDKNPNNKFVHNIVARHVDNMIATYGKEKVFKVLTDVVKAHAS